MADAASIKAGLRSAFRDHNIDGVPGSGAYEVNKGAVREALAPLVDLAVASGTTKVVGPAADLAGLTDPQHGDRAEVRDDPAGDVEGGNGVWGYDEGTLNWVWISPLVPPVPLAEAAASAAAAEAAAAEMRSTMDFDATDARVHDGAVYDPVSRRYVIAVLVSSGRLIGAGFEQQFAFQTPYPNVLHIVLHGQSNSAGNAGYENVTTGDTGRGSLRFAMGVKTYVNSTDKANPANRPASAFGLAVLKPDDPAGNVGENSANGVADALKDELTQAFALTSQAESYPRILVTCAAEGSRFLSELGPDAIGTPGGHFATQMDDAIRAKAAATARGWSYGVGAVVLTQGENEEAFGKLLPAETNNSYSNTGLRSGYLTQVVEYFDAAEAGYLSSGAITRALPCFLEQIAVTSLTSRRIATAQLMAASARRNTFVTGPMYQYPSALLELAPGLYYGNSPHFTSDGQRWKGEKAAQAIGHVLKRREAWRPMQMIGEEIVSSTVRRLTFHVPKPPLVLDTTFLAKVKGFGIVVYPGDADAPGAGVYPTAVEIVGPNQIEITLPTPVAGGYTALGDQTADVGGPLTVASVGSVVGGAADGTNNFTLTVTGDHRPALAALINEGLFYAQGSGGAAGQASGPIRAVSLVGGDTVLKGEARELTSGGSYRAFTAGDALTFLAYLPRTNIRDSDQHLSATGFANPDTNTAARLGKPYPMWNWACLTDGPVSF